MPELPEVETVKRGLFPLCGQTCVSITTSSKPLRSKRLSSTKLRKAFVGAKIKNIDRWGKQLFLEFEGRTNVLAAHLGMSGRLRLFSMEDEIPPHSHFILRTKDRLLVFSDPRRFGNILVLSENDRANLSLGPDGYTGEIYTNEVFSFFAKSDRSVKTILLDQRVIAGVGNIYASEALWLAQISPMQKGKDLSYDKFRLLCRMVKESFRTALERGGTSLKDFVAADGQAGENAHYLKVYGRENIPCERCRSPIIKLALSGRATFYCADCQEG